MVGGVVVGCGVWEYVVGGEKSGVKTKKKTQHLFFGNCDLLLLSVTKNAF